MDQLNEFARLLIEIGVNVQKDQRLVITIPVDCAPFARLCTSAAYRAGCKEVILNWTDDYVNREWYLFADDTVIDRYQPWRKTLYDDYTRDGAAFLNISASDPEVLKNVDPGRIMRQNKANSAVIEQYWQGIMTNKNQWCLTSYPSLGWARKVFPGMPEQEAVAALWDIQYKAMRIRSGRDSVEIWKMHLERLDHRKKVLTNYAFKSLRYVNGLGTDITVQLPPRHLWEGGAEKSAAGVLFCANMPTEEVYTAPIRTGTEGIVHASRPLALHGNIIEDFSLRFEQGRVVDVRARVGQEILENAIATDDGAQYLGEVALVPFSSPISQSGILFYNTLFDESSSCHLALGHAYSNIEGGNDMTPEELAAHGLNDSSVHIDFMIGTDDLSVIGTTEDGREIPVFTDGNFVF